MNWKKAIEYRDGTLHVDGRAVAIGLGGGFAVFLLLEAVLPGGWLYPVAWLVGVVAVAVDVRLRRRDHPASPRTAELTRASRAARVPTRPQPSRQKGQLAGRRPVTPDEFQQRVRELRRQRPQWFALPADAAPSDEQVEAHQDRLGVRLPDEYLAFLRQEGGGDFAMLVVYSMEPGSDLNIVLMNDNAWLQRDDFVAVSDNGAGDYYGFLVRDGVCQPEVVLLDHESGQFHPTGASDFFEFVLKEGLLR